MYIYIYVSLRGNAKKMRVNLGQNVSIIYLALELYMYHSFCLNTRKCGLCERRALRTALPKKTSNVQRVKWERETNMDGKKLERRDNQTPRHLRSHKRSQPAIDAAEVAPVLALLAHDTFAYNETVQTNRKSIPSPALGKAARAAEGWQAPFRNRYSVIQQQ